MIGLARDAEQRHTTLPGVEWTANTGFLTVLKDSLDLLESAIVHGDEPRVWGIADQGALNAVAWAEQRITEIDVRWNYAAVLEYFLHGRGWDAWLRQRNYRMSFYLRLLLRSRHPVIQRARQCYGLHMIRAPYPAFFDRVIP